MRALAADARLLHAAERGRRVGMTAVSEIATKGPTSPPTVNCSVAPACPSSVSKTLVLSSMELI